VQKNDYLKCRRIRRATEDAIALSAARRSIGIAPQPMQIPHSVNQSPPNQSPVAPIGYQAEHESNSDGDENMKQNRSSSDDELERDLDDKKQANATGQKADFLDHIITTFDVTVKRALVLTVLAVAIIWGYF
jgi:hypothetical protein